MSKVEVEAKTNDGVTALDTLFMSIMGTYWVPYVQYDLDKIAKGDEALVVRLVLCEEPEKMESEFAARNEEFRRKEIYTQLSDDQTVVFRFFEGPWEDTIELVRIKDGPLSYNRISTRLRTLPFAVEELGIVLDDSCIQGPIDVLYHVMSEFEVAAQTLREVLEHSQQNYQTMFSMDEDQKEAGTEAEAEAEEKDSK